MNKDIPKDANKELLKEDRSELFQKCKNGEVEHTQYKSLSKNLIPLNERSEEEAREIRRKGALAMHELRGEKKNAKQILDTLLPLYANNNAIKDSDNIPIDIKEEILRKNLKITQYDLIMLSMIHKAQGGDVKASEYISNLFGDIVTKEVKVSESISESDKALINKLKSRLNIEGTETDIIK